ARTVCMPEGAPGDRLHAPTTKPVVPVRIEMEKNVCQLWRAFSFISASSKSPKGLPVETQQRVIPKLIRWHEDRNIYDLSDESFLNVSPTGLLSGLAEWNKFWGLKDTGSMQGAVRLRGNPKNRIARAPESITPDDFRLRSDSAGYQAGKDKKDLGADVDLVGPGPAYERWKKTPEYQQWLKDTGQLRAEASKPEPKAFVLLGEKDAEVGKFDTVADAVQRASSGDTIEIRGNGPFVTDPLALGPTALTIRAGLGYAPVITANTAVTKSSPLLSSRSALTLEGLELRYEARSDNVGRYLVSSTATLSITNCKLLLPKGKDSQPTAINWASQSGRIRNSLIMALPEGYALLLGNSPGMK